MNRLQQETSPYLLQHAHNPVDWYAWRPEAFGRARAEQKPILVSIGYSTCHWCHVMERESFENEDIAGFMNEHFINIKVDREERPDVDAIYMEACQILTGGGGWPLNCFLTPDGKPFYAGTYFPPRPAYGRPSWLQLLQHLAGIWETKRDVAFDQAEKLLAHIRRNDDVFVRKNAAPAKLPTPDLVEPETLKPASLETLFNRMREQFDRAEGGFGGAPKFPSTMAIRFLLHYHYFTGQPEALEHAVFSLDKMIRGGIYDQIGGGFARYATDREWLVPHFEKMLYDNALLVSVLAEAYKLTGKELYREAIGETLAYVEREMTSPEGAFYSAQDADSEGEEGKFYVWDKSEIDELLGEKADVFGRFYGVSESGNWEGKNILRRPATYEEFATRYDLDLATLKKELLTGRRKMFLRRSQRVWPGLDHKILLSWNALMVSACADAFTALGEGPYRAAAVRNLDWLIANFGGPDAELRHSSAQTDAFLEDYAFLIAALTDVYQITFNVRYLQLAGKYTTHVLSYFHDPETGLFFFTDVRQADVVVRKKDLYDNATPSGNSTMAHNLQRLGILLDRPEWRELASRMLATMRETVERYPLSFERWATALMNEAYPLHEIAVVGGNAEEKALAIQQGFLPNKVVAAAAGPDDTVALLAGKSGQPDALIYVCRDFACQRPVSTLDEFRQLVQSG